MNEVFGEYVGLIDTRPIEHLGSADLSFDGQLSPAMKIYEDGGASGCGGKVWIAGELLCEYLIEKSDSENLLCDGSIKNILELGSGTGLVGICVGLMEKQRFHKDIKVSITDIGGLVPLMERNILLNKIADATVAKELMWGQQLPSEYMTTSVDGNCDNVSNVDLVVAADCVYAEKAFPLLEKILLDLTNCDNPPIILMAYRKRRKADKRFFVRIRKNFDVIEIDDFSSHEKYMKQRTHLFELKRK
ncbi:hypothetical protein KAFR_0H03290 [Kazachstania africana CBS 2517]|uniref:Protein-lysine N-methyltransferase EFM6 n=1 Tax=Kazachstania africana (strain ATCC 22294 / BCRC 22015 / CBS 2517 / CECT 1963 / NBRC 1671 / NRRL Y-8276) TaxID=1071382 RepID=H2AZI3_KAZAF|nr:hypothetical protein KAFR_0H03290 [Kazachstania africana CBS 2517]CCF59739.1 hypothetical protein KAFR_0H03290 [Kazachstania africana CBS 2517]